MASLILLPMFFYAYNKFAVYEERELIEALGDDYLEYMDRVRRWVPF
jgi:protein-S-isoprenylcysteine O-methyltransferase Ste14